MQPHAQTARAGQGAPHKDPVVEQHHQRRREHDLLGAHTQ